MALNRINSNCVVGIAIKIIHVCVCVQDLFLALFLANELATLFGVLLFNDIVFTLKYFIYKISNVLFHTFYFFTVTSRRRFYQSHSD